MNSNPYQTPQADLVTSDAIPESFLHGKITARQLGTAGWLSILYLIFSLPLDGFALFAEYVQNESLKKVGEVLSVFNVIFYSYLMLVLKTFLQARIPGLSINVITYLIIISNFIILIITLTIPVPDTADYLKLLSYYAVLFIPAGILTLIYGIKFLRVKIHYPHLKVFGWLIIVTGICLLSIVLFMLVIPLGIATDIYLAILFFQGRRELLAHRA